MFRFRLQRVLELREEAEQAASRALAEARTAADEARRAKDALAGLHATSRAEIGAAQQQESRVGHLHQLGVVLRSLEERLDSAMEQVQAADGVVHGAQGQLDLAARDRRVLDRLKERHAESWRALEAHKDRIQMDEIALAGFARKKDSHGGAHAAPHTSSNANTSAGNGAGNGASPRNDGPNR